MSCFLQLQLKLLLQDDWQIADKQTRSYFDMSTTELLRKIWNLTSMSPGQASPPHFVYHYLIAFVS